MDVIQFLKTLYRYLSVLILLPVVAMLITFLIVKNKEGDYQARAVISSGFVEAQSSPGNEGRVNRDQIAFRYANLLQMVNSKPVLDLVAYSLLKHDLDNPEAAFRLQGSTLRDLSESQRDAFSDSLGRYLERYQSMSDRELTGSVVKKILDEKSYNYRDLDDTIRFFRQGQSDYIFIVAETENPELSAYIANTLAQTLIDFYRLRQENTLATNIQFYLEQVSDRERQLDERTTVLQNFKVQNSITNLYEQTKAIAVQISDFEFLRQNENKTFLGAQSLMDSLDVVLRGDRIDTSEGQAAMLNSRVAIARSSIADLNRRRVNAEIRGDNTLADELQLQINDERTQLANTISNINNQAFADPRVSRQQLLTQRLLLSVDKENARQALSQINSELNRLRDLTREFARLEANLNSYDREIDLAERDYLAMLDRLNQFRLTQRSMSSGSQMEKVELAIPPEDPLPARKLIIILAAAFGSFGFALVSIFVVEYFDLSIRNSKQLANRTGKPVLGIIPKLEEQEFSISELFSGRSGSPALSAMLALVRSLRSHIEAGMTGKRLLITSSQADTGKTLITLILSYALGQTGKKVLIVDTNTVSNDLTVQFQAEPALLPYLAGTVSLPNAITKTVHENIDVLGCETSLFSLQENVAREKIKQGFEALDNYYDYVIIDSTRMLRHNNAREVLPFVTDTVCVFSSGEVVNGIDNAVIQEFDHARASFLGCILNKTTLEDVEDLFGEMEQEHGYMRNSYRRLLKGNVKGAFNEKKGNKLQGGTGVRA